MSKGSRRNEKVGRSGAAAPSGCQPTASAANASSQSGIPNAETLEETIARVMANKGVPLQFRLLSVAALTKSGFGPLCDDDGGAHG